MHSSPIQYLPPPRGHKYLSVLSHMLMPKYVIVLFAFDPSEKSSLLTLAFPLKIIIMKISHVVAQKGISFSFLLLSSIPCANTPQTIHSGCMNYSFFPSHLQTVLLATSLFSVSVSLFLFCYIH